MPDLIQEDTPYEADSEDREGRVAIQIPEISDFTVNTSEIPGSAIDVPYEDEMAHDPVDGAFYVLKRDPITNTVIPLSHSKAIEQRLNEIEATGVFEDALAFKFNTQVNKLYFDNTRMTVKALKTLAFKPIYKYYAIRGLQNTAQGNPSYVTGIYIQDGSGSTLTNLVDMGTGLDDNGNPYSYFETGHLIEPMIHANNYVVEFYDADRELLENVPFQGISVRYLSWDMTPDVAVEDLQVITNQPTGNSNECKVFIGQDINELSIRVYVKYVGDASPRDVTHEQYVGGKLTIEGLTAIDVGTLTGDTDTPQTFTVKYRLSQIPVTSPDFDENTMTISKTISVYIVPDVGDVPYRLLVGGWIENNAGSFVAGIKFFAHYATGTSNEKGVLREITALLKSITLTNFTYMPEKEYFRSNAVIIGNTYTALISVPFANSSSQDFRFNVLASNGGAGSRKVRTSVGQGVPVEPIEEIEFGQSAGVFKWNSSNSGGFSGQPVYPHTEVGFKQRFPYLEGGDNIEPTHFVIKNLQNPTYIYREMSNLNIGINTGFTINNSIDYPVIAELPVLVEFYHINIDTTTAEWVSTCCTGSKVFHVKLVA
jgi:hypothetical protein